MQNKEIENMKEDLEQLYHMLDNKKPSISTNAIKNALQYIDQLETREQKLIDKTKEFFRRQNEKKCRIQSQNNKL